MFFPVAVDTLGPVENDGQKLAEMLCIVDLWTIVLSSQ